MTSRLPRLQGEGREEKGKGMGRRLLSRMRTVLRKPETSRQQQQSRPEPTPAAAPPHSSSPPTVEPLADTAVVSAASQPTPPAGNVESRQVEDASPAINGEKVPRAQIYGERAQYLADRFGLEVDSQDKYRLDGHVLRVHKPLRMRVHRQCHQCGSELNATGSCEQCSHNFCRQCTRYPPKRDEAEKAASRDKKADMVKEREANAMITPDWNPQEAAAPIVVKRPNRPCGQQELVYKKVRQRVRRICCQCQELGGVDVVFGGGKRNCPECNHSRCTDCPRDPAKKSKYPYGYPGDEFGAKSIPHYRCHECFSDYPPGVTNGTACTNCSHEKCNICERLRPQKVEVKPDPEALRSVQEKMAAMELGQPTLAS